MFNYSHIHTQQKAEERRLIEAKTPEFLKEASNRIQLIPMGKVGTCIIPDSTLVLEELP